MGSARLIKWDTRKDVFERGQWFHGHVYAGRSDLSPDGSLLIYFASKFNKKTLQDKEYTYAWTAISKPPFYTALALWPKGNCWHGGGLFDTNRAVLLNHRPDAAIPHPAHKPGRSLRIRPNPDAAGEDDSIAVPRNERDGWKFVQWLEYDYRSQRTVRPCIFEKALPAAQAKLRVEKYYDGLNESWLCSIDAGKRSLEIGIGTWADIDHRGRILFASDGKIHNVELAQDATHLTEIADFNTERPRPIRTPDWAKKW